VGHWLDYRIEIPYFLRLIKDCQESIIQQVTNGAGVLAVNGLRKRIEDVGIGVNIDNFNLNDSNSNGSSKGYNDTTDRYDSAHNIN